jgi:hypothetical protein
MMIRGLPASADGHEPCFAMGRSGTASVIDTVGGGRIAGIPVGELSWYVVTR